VVTITKAGEVFLKKEQMTPAMLQQRLQEMPPESKKEGIYLRADKSVAYGVVTSTMADIHAAGFDKLGMITVPAENEK
jgi:biopolymer transport protein TolR